MELTIIVIITINNNKKNNTKYPLKRFLLRILSNEVLNKETEPMCVVVEDREDNCVKCHICTTACKLKAITID